MLSSHARQLSYCFIVFGTLLDPIGSIQWSLPVSWNRFSLCVFSYNDVDLQIRILLNYILHYVSYGMSCVQENVGYFQSKKGLYPFVCKGA